jgi:hypothetical protein
VVFGVAHQNTPEKLVGQERHGFGNHSMNDARLRSSLRPSTADKNSPCQPFQYDQRYETKNLRHPVKARLTYSLSNITSIILLVEYKTPQTC